MKLRFIIISGFLMLYLFPAYLQAQACQPCLRGRFDKVNCVIGTKAQLKPLNLKLDVRYWYDDRYGSLYRAANKRHCEEGRFDGVNCVVRTKQSIQRAGLQNFLDEGRFWFDPRYGAVYTKPLNCKDKAYQKNIFGYPFSKNKTFRVDNAFFGYGGHARQYNVPHAVDFIMPEGTFIHAAKAGTIIKAVSHFQRGGNDPSFGPRANEIVIDHHDGTFGVYLHFKYKGVAVKPGQHVKLGQYIGKSGATGWVTDPHLHFDVRVKDSRGMLTRSNPWKFRKPNGDVFTPELGMQLKH